MIDPETLAVTFGLSSAIAWGAGDFSGGFATRRNPVLTVLFLSQVIGGILLVTMALFLDEPVPGFKHLAAGALAGLFGALGLVCLYRGLALGRMELFLSLVAGAGFGLFFIFIEQVLPVVIIQGRADSVKQVLEKVSGLAVL
ncbi:MAG: EamA family transporter [Desulfosarcina sp.]|nr:EamA family transporter [Desulfobacterales bacterium]